MDDIAQCLCRALGVNTAQSCFILQMNDWCTAGGADRGHLIGLCILCVIGNTDHFRDDITRLAHLNGIADAKAELMDKILIVQVARATVVPARKTGSKQAVGVRTPVRPTATSMLRSVVSFTSGGYLNAIAQRGNLLVEPIKSRCAKSFTLITAPSISKSSLARFWPICSISAMACSMSCTI